MDEKEEAQESKNSYSIIKPSSAFDSYDDIVTSKKSIVEDFAKHQPTTCEICGLTARTNLELRDHIKHAHRM